MCECKILCYPTEHTSKLPRVSQSSASGVRTSEDPDFFKNEHLPDYGITVYLPVSLYIKSTSSAHPLCSSYNPQNMSNLQTLPASGGTAFLLQKDQIVKIINTHGRQVVDFWALNPANPAEYLSMSHNHAIHRKIRFKAGDTLYSSISQPILSWVEDTSRGDHDTLISACNPLRYEKMGVKGWHASCAENYQKAVKGLAAASISQERKDRLPVTPPTPLNLFMNVMVNEEGSIIFTAPTSKERDYVAFKALMDVIIVLSAVRFSLRIFFCSSRSGAPTHCLGAPVLPLKRITLT